MVEPSIRKRKTETWTHEGIAYIHSECPFCGMGICADIDTFNNHKNKCAVISQGIKFQSTLSDFAAVI